MKRCFKLIIIMFTLVLTFSACTKGETDYTPTSFESDVSFAAQKGQVKGNLRFLNGDEISFTVSEPENLKGCVFQLKGGNMKVCYDGVNAEIRENSPVGRLFLVLENFASETYKIKKKGIDTFKNTTETGDYELVFDCENKKIKEVYTDKTVYIFL